MRSNIFKYVGIFLDFFFLCKFEDRQIFRFFCFIFLGMANSTASNVKHLLGLIIYICLLYSLGLEMQ